MEERPTLEEKPTFVVRISQWIRNLRPQRDGLPLERRPAEEQHQPGEQPEPRPTLSLWRPWARRDAAIASLQQGFGTLSELMESIRDNLERQGQRQDEMISYLSSLPDVLQSLPESQRMHAEALAAISRQIEQQVQQQERLTEVLAQLGQSQADQHDAVAGLHERVQSLAQHNETISDNLRQVGSAMETMGRSSESGAQVLRRLHEEMSARSGEMERTIERQQSRLNTLLITAIALSATAIVGVLVVAILLATR